MPKMCFSYQPDLPQGIGTRGVVPPSLRDPHRMPAACFSYTADMSPGAGGTCFSYTADVPPRPARRDAAEPLPSGLRSMTFGTCFRY